MSWLLRVPETPLPLAACREVYCLKLCRAGLLVNPSLVHVLCRSAGVLFCCAVSGKCACAFATHHATVSQLNGGEYLALDHLLLFACTMAQTPKVPVLHQLKRHLSLVTSGLRADCKQDVLQKCPTPGVHFWQYLVLICPPAGCLAVSVLLDNVSVAV